MQRVQCGDAARVGQPWRGCERQQPRATSSRRCRRALCRRLLLTWTSYNQHGFNALYIYTDLLLNRHRLVFHAVGARRSSCGWPQRGGHTEWSQWSLQMCFTSLPPPGDMPQAGPIGLWSLSYGVWALVYYTRTGKWLYPFLDIHKPWAPVRAGDLRALKTGRVAGWLDLCNFQTAATRAAQPCLASELHSQSGALRAVRSRGQECLVLRAGRVRRPVPVPLAGVRRCGAAIQGKGAVASHLRQAQAQAPVGG
jgi:hypothetical protein